MVMKNRRSIVLSGLTIAILFYLTDTIVVYLQSRDYLLNVMTSTRLTGLGFIALLTIVFLIRYAKKSETKTKEQNSEKSVSGWMDPLFLSAILNQFKIPLNVIVGFSNLLRNPGLDPHTTARYSDFVFHNSTPLLPLLENVIDLFKIETGQVSIKTEDCNVNKVMDEIFRECNAESYPDQGEGTPEGLVRTGHTAELTIRSDYRRLKQILSNLVTNSIQFSDLERIEVGYEIKNDFLEFYIKDGLQDLSVDDLDAIYTGYENNSTIRNQSLIVAALRLTIAQKLIHALEGDIRTKTKKKNRKDTFFNIPLKVAVKKDKTSETDERKKIPAWDDYKLLIAEDIESNFIYLKEVLKPTNIQITWAGNGKEAVEMIEQNPDFDIILMDILMPEMDGFEAARKIKELNRNIPIVVQTAYSLESEPEETLACFDEFLTKPIWYSDLIRMLSRFLQ